MHGHICENVKDTNYKITEEFIIKLYVQTTDKQGTFLKIRYKYLYAMYNIHLIKKEK